MDGKEHERDDAQPYYRYGQDPRPDEGAYGDEGRPVDAGGSTHAPPGYERSAYQSPAYEASAYEAPAYETPAYGARPPNGPGYETPGYEPPGYETPGYEPPGYETPGYEPPGYETPGYERPGYEAPAYDQQPVYRPFAAQQPTAQQPTAQQPSSPQPTAQQPTAQQPAAQPLAHRQPAFREAPTYGGTSRDAGPDTAGFEAHGYPTPDRFADAPTSETVVPRGLVPEATGQHRGPAWWDEQDTEVRDSGVPGRRSRRGVVGDGVGGDGSIGDEDRFAGRSRAFRTRRSMPLWQELPLLLIVAFCMAVLIRTFLLQAFYIPSSSMEETLLVGDRVLVNKIVYDVRQPARGEVIVFAGPSNWTPENPQVSGGSMPARVGRTLGDLVGMSRPGEKDFIKRVIGVPGDRVSCCDPAGRIYVNGKGIDEPYINVNSALDVQPNPRTCSSRRFDEVLVPPGQLFVMGDNRIVSQDSRCQGTIPIENVIGRAFVIVWPSARWDSLSVPETFQSVPPPVAMGPAAGPVAMGPAAAGPSSGLATTAVTVPILACLAAHARSGRKWRWVRRTLPT